jgi:hypothetical protein
VLNVEKTITVDDLFETISRIVTCIPNLSQMECNMIQIIGFIEFLTKLISVMGKEEWKIIPTHEQTYSQSLFRLIWLNRSVITVSVLSGKLQSIIFIRLFLELDLKDGV